MRTAEAPRYRFRPMAETDLPMLAAWLAEPHVAQWWGDPKTGLAEMQAAMSDPSTEPSIVEFEDMPIAYLQCYDPHREPGHPYADQPQGTLGFDLSIGPAELVGIGHGSAVLRQAVEARFDGGMRRAVIDPDPANARAVRAYEKAGFKAVDRRSTVYGDVLLMARDAPSAGQTR